MIIRLASLAIAGAMVVCVGLAVAAEAPLPQDVPRVNQEQARAVLGNPDFVILDVRKSSDWEGSDSKIQGAIREDPSNVNAWIDKYPKDKTLLFYCN
jgi:rhodanese-related sulfurtransferase